MHKLGGSTFPHVCDAQYCKPIIALATIHPIYSAARTAAMPPPTALSTTRRRRAVIMRLPHPASPNAHAPTPVQGPLSGRACHSTRRWNDRHDTGVCLCPRRRVCARARLPPPPAPAGGSLGLVNPRVRVHTRWSAHDAGSAREVYTGAIGTCTSARGCVAVGGSCGSRVLSPVTLAAERAVPVTRGSENKKRVVTGQAQATRTNNSGRRCVGGRTCGGGGLEGGKLRGCGRAPGVHRHCAEAQDDDDGQAPEDGWGHGGWPPHLQCDA